MIDFYYWPTPNGWKVSILLEELGIPYTVKMLNIAAGDQFDPNFLKISPNNRMPAIVDHDVDGDPVSVFESGAIMLYLAEKYGAFMPQDALARKDVMEWLFWQVGNQGPMLGQHSHFFNYAPDTERGGYASARYKDAATHCLSILNTRLENRDWVAADQYTIADMICFPWVLIAKAMQLPLNDYPHLIRWRSAIKQRPAVQRGVDLARDQTRRAKPNEDERKILFGQNGTQIQSETK